MKKMLRSVALFLLLPMLKTFGSFAMASLLPKVFTMLITPSTKQAKRGSFSFWNRTTPQPREEDGFCIWKLITFLFSLGVVINGVMFVFKRLKSHRATHVQRRITQQSDVQHEDNDASGAPSVLQIDGQPRQIIITLNADSASNGGSKIEVL